MTENSAVQEHPEWIQKVHQLNDVLHREPIASVVEGFFWYLCLLIACPLLAFASLFHAAYKVIDFYFLKKEILPKNLHGKELAVIITGCDSGFGKELVFSLVSKGFTVFACCLQKESFEHFKGEPKIIPLQVNITNDKDVDEAYKIVSKWLSEKGNERCLHALVNNAGTGVAGLSDWMKVEDFQKIMDVNFFGAIRCITKLALPILKQQVADNSYTNARIVNMVSTAGLFAGGVLGAAYESSKHALDAYTINLRVELQALSIKVVAVNPGLHKTPLAEGTSLAAGTKKVWDAMTPEHQAQYGDDYCNAVMAIFEHSTGKFQWDKKYVVEALDEAVVSANPPDRMLVGLDAKYFLYPFSKLPTSLRINMIRQTPAMMMMKK